MSNGIVVTSEIPTFTATGLASLSGTHAGQYEFSFSSAPPTDFSLGMAFIALDHTGVGGYFVEGSHQRLAYFRGDGGGSYEGVPVVVANLPETDPGYNSSTRKTVYMPAGWTFV